MKKLIATALFGATMLTAATSASATTYIYKQNNGAVLTLDTANNRGTLIGRDINVSFTSSDLANFTGGAKPSGSFTLDNLDGYRKIRGRRYYDNPSHTQKLIISDNGRTNLWSHWGTTPRYGDYITYVRKYYPPTTGSSGGSTSTGGSTGGGSTGGTDVPAPGMLALFGLGAGALAFRRRRNKKNA
ncbi:MAG: PEP-CTERM sorting domain-containing protein [Sphingorhabdus sp.]